MICRGIFHTGNRYNQSHLNVIHFGPSDLYHEFKLLVHNNTLIDPPSVEFEVSLSIPTHAYQLGVMLGVNHSATVVVVDSGTESDSANYF